MKRLISFVLAAALLCTGALALDADCKGAILIEKETGQVLYQKDADMQLEPASVTKVMTLLLIMEALESGAIGLEDTVTVSDRAASMGGSQIYLEPGEKMSVHDLLKAVTVASANDAAVALGEFIAGSEEGFVERMNSRAAELGMKNTVFLNCTGLPQEGHVTSAADIAIMSRELINHEKIKEYTTIWMDTLRSGQWQLSNTNKLIRYYEGATGLKTGSTQNAGYCLAATAQRNGMELIAVVLGAETGDKRFAAARELLDYGFASFTLVTPAPDEVLSPVKVALGRAGEVQPVPLYTGRLLVEKTQAASLQKSAALLPEVQAPVAQGQQLGVLTVKSGETVVAEIPLVAAEEVEKVTFWDIFCRLLHAMTGAAA